MDKVKIEELRCRYWPRKLKEIKCSCGANMQQFEGPGFFAVVAYCRDCNTYKYQKES